MNYKAGIRVPGKKRGGNGRNALSEESILENVPKLEDLIPQMKIPLSTKQTDKSRNHKIQKLKVSCDA